MRIAHLEVERFRGLRNVDVQLNTQLQLVAGPNNAGKTTLLRALDFFFSPHSYSLAAIQPQNDYYGEEGGRALTRVRIYLSDLNPTETSDFNALLNRYGEFWVEVRVTKTGQLGFLASKEQPGEEAHAAVCDRFNVAYVPAVRVEREQGEDGDLQRLGATVREVLVRTRPGRRTRRQARFQKIAARLMKHVEKVLNDSTGGVDGLVLPGVELSFQMPSPTVLLQGLLREVRLKTRSGTDLHLEDEGTGLQSLLSLAVLEQASRPEPGRESLFLIEEPEAFLHPQFQRAVAGKLRVLSQKAQVVVSTHAASIVNAFDLPAVCRLPRDPRGLTFTRRVPSFSDAEIGRLTRFVDTQNSELIFADRVVFCEGITDARIVAELIRNSLGKGPEHINVSVIAIQGSTNAEVFMQLARHFSVPSLFVLDKDVYGKKDTRKLADACKAFGSPLSDPERQSLNDLADRPCNRHSHATKIRDKANAILLPRGIFTLASDIEFSVATSMHVETLVELLGPEGARHLSEESVAELTSLQPTPYYERLRMLLGSKGWKCAESNRSNKPKPHVLPSVVAKTHGRRRTANDIDALALALSSFLAANP